MFIHFSYLKLKLSKRFEKFENTVPGKWGTSLRESGLLSERSSRPSQNRFSIFSQIALKVSYPKKWVEMSKKIIFFAILINYCLFLGAQKLPKNLDFSCFHLASLEKPYFGRKYKHQRIFWNGNSWLAKLSNEPDYLRIGWKLWWWGQLYCFFGASGFFIFILYS